jgi:WD40 repeat protein
MVCRAGVLSFIDTRNGRRVRRVPGCATAVVLPDGKRIAVVPDDEQSVRLLELDSLKRLREFSGLPVGARAYTLVVSQDGKYIAASDRHRGGGRLWEVATGKLVGRLDDARSVAFRSDGRQLLVTGGRSTSQWSHRLMDLPDGRCRPGAGGGRLVPAGRQGHGTDLPAGATGPAGAV